MIITEQDIRIYPNLNTILFATERLWTQPALCLC